jgi:hypothetical protein
MLVFKRLSEKLAIPSDLALLYDFVNSLDLRRLDPRRYVEQGTAHDPSDGLATPAQLREKPSRLWGLGGAKVRNVGGWIAGDAH